MHTRPILVFGQFSREDLDVINDAAEESACTLSHASSIEQALGWLDEHEAHGLLCHSEDSELLAVQTRSRAGLSRLPVLTLSKSLTDLDFASAFSWGADDVVPGEPCVVRTIAHGHPCLGRHEPVTPGGSERLAQDLLREAGRVDVGGVDHVDAGVLGHRELLSSALHVDLSDGLGPTRPAEPHGAQRDGGDAQAGPAQLAVLHALDRNRPPPAFGGVRLGAAPTRRT